MAVYTSATTKWRVSPTGNNKNGAGFDPALGSVGLTVTDLVGTAGSAVVTSVTGGFTSAMVNCHAKIGGSGFIAGWYRIVTYTNTNTITLEFSPVPANKSATGGSASVTTNAVDYTAQDASPIADLTDLVSSGTTLTSASNLFTSNMVGNALLFTSAGGATAGYYFITNYVGAGQVTLDRGPGNGSSQHATLGGACATHVQILSTVVAVTPGNIVYVNGSGSNTTHASSADYTFTGYVIPPVGDTTTGLIRIIGINGRPKIQGNGLLFYQCTGIWLENFYLTTSSNNFATLGILNASSLSTFKNVVLDTNSQTSCCGAILTDRSHLIDSEIWSGGTSPTFDALSYGIILANYDCDILGSYIHHCRGYGINESGVGSGGNIVGNIITNNKGGGINVVATTVVGTKIINNTIDSNTGDNITIAAAASLANTVIVNNQVTNGTINNINVSAGTAAVNNLLRTLIDFNNVYGAGTANYVGISAGANDMSIDPQYVSPSTANYIPSWNTVNKGFPLVTHNIGAGNSGTPSYATPGVMSPPSNAGGGSIFSQF